MKWIRLGLMSLFLAVFVSALSHRALANTVAKHPVQGSAQKTPEDLAKEALAKWKPTLSITDRQAPQFESVMKDSYRKMAKAKAAAAGDQVKMGASMQTILKDRETALAKILTPDQMKIYREKLPAAAAHARKYVPPEGASK